MEVRSMKKILLAMGIISFLLIPISGFSQLAPELPRDETLICDATGRNSVPKWFNPLVRATFFSGGYHLALDSLWYIHPSVPEMRWDNALAAEPPIYNDDFTKMTVKLRKGIYWSDGVEFTADDVVFTVKTEIDNPGTIHHSTYKVFVDKVYKKDDYTVVFELKKPNSRFHTNFLAVYWAAYFVPKHIWKKVEKPLEFDFYPPVSLGPYMLESTDPGGYWALWKRREDWDRTSLGMTQGKPKPKYVLYIFHGPSEKRIMASSRHELDVIYQLTPEAWEALRRKNPYARCWRENFPWAWLAGDSVNCIAFNCDVYPFGIKDVRWALTLATDGVKAIMMITGGQARMTATHVTASRAFDKWYFEPLESWLRDFTLDIDGEPFKPYDPSAPLRLAQSCEEKGYSVPHEPKEIREMFGFGLWKHAPKIAEKLLKKHGFERDSNGKWLLPDGTPWKIVMLTYTIMFPMVQRQAYVVAQQWRDFGIDVEVEVNEVTSDMLVYGRFEVATAWPINTWGCHPDLFRSYGWWHSDHYAPIEEAVSYYNPTRWTDKRMDQVVEKMRQTSFFDEPKTIEAGREAIKIMVEEMPFIPMYSFTSFTPADNYYWTNFPGAENPYAFFLPNCITWKYVLPELQSTGRKE